MDIDALARGLQAGGMHVVTNEEAMHEGWRRALDTLFDDALAQTAHEKAAARARRRELENPKDGRTSFSAVRAALDSASSDHVMDRKTARFYLAMSPKSFAKALKRAPHPFAGKDMTATKAEIDAWFVAIVQEKHKKDLPQAKPLRISRDLETGRPYLVDESGVILADGQVSRITEEDARHALEQGAGIRILALSTALGMPWASKEERNAWADFRRRRLTQQLQELQAAIDRAQEQDIGASVPQGKERGPRGP